MVDYDPYRSSGEHVNRFTIRRCCLTLHRLFYEPFAGYSSILWMLILLLGYDASHADFTPWAETLHHSRRPIGILRYNIAYLTDSQISSRIPKLHDMHLKDECIQHTGGVMIATSVLKAKKRDMKMKKAIYETIQTTPVFDGSYMGTCQRPSIEF